MTRKLVTVLLACVACGVLPAVASADSPVGMCVPSAANTAITTPNTDGTCPGGKAKRFLADQADLTAAKARITALESTLTGVTRATVNGQPTLTFSGENVRIINGAGTTSDLNGKGNLILGYNSDPGPQTGSHNVIVGNSDTATSYGSLIVGRTDSSRGPYETVLGFDNAADHQYANALGGQGNRVAANFATVSGGRNNTASADSASVSGGVFNTASGDYASVSGGYEGMASGNWASVSGGYEGVASGDWASVSGGEAGTASGDIASVSGGSSAHASGNYSSNLGGDSTDAPGDFSTYPAGP